jgi:putative SOS response-associated peptidase YedK
MGTKRHIQTALLLRSERWRAICICWVVGQVEGLKDSYGNWVKTCSILTTTPNAVTSPVHDRMPVILDPASYDVWLDPGMRDADAICELLKPYDARLMRCYPVTTRINHVANDDEESSRRTELSETQNPLFA